ncbi:hypothetical protein THAOC_09943, partial [Thalassiosira oceanica]
QGGYGQGAAVAAGYPPQGLQGYGPGGGYAGQQGGGYAGQSYGSAQGDGYGGRGGDTKEVEEGEGQVQGTVRQPPRRRRRRGGRRGIELHAAGTAAAGAGSPGRRGIGGCAERQPRRALSAQLPCWGDEPGQPRIQLRELHRVVSFGFEFRLHFTKFSLHAKILCGHTWAPKNSTTGRGGTSSPNGVAARPDSSPTASPGPARQIATATGPRATPARSSRGTGGQGGYEGQHQGHGGQQGGAAPNNN